MKPMLSGLCMFAVLSSGATAWAGDDCDSLIAASLAQTWFSGSGDCGSASAHAAFEWIDWNGTSRDCNTRSPNDCAHELFVHPPEVATGAGDGGSMKWAFNKKLLNGKEVKCVDGSRAGFYFLPADDGSTDKWLVGMHGGGSCGTGQLCVDRYNFDNAENSQKNREEMSSLQEDYFDGTSTVTSRRWRQEYAGAYSDDVTKNPHFQNWNRIVAHQCTYDKHMGANGYQSTEGGSGWGDFVYDPDAHVIDTTGQTIKFHFRGKRRLRALIANIYSDLYIVPEEGVQGRLPGVPDANSTWLFLGQSSGSEGLTHMLDFLADEVRSHDNGATVLGVLDAISAVAVEQECGAPAGSPYDIWDHLLEDTACSGVTTAFPYDATTTTFYDTGDFGQGYQMFNAQVDQSCLAAHPIDAWLCNIPTHVQSNHVTSPKFVYADYSDKGRLDKGKGAAARWAAAGSLPLCDKDIDDETCVDPNGVVRFRGLEYRQRLANVADAWNADQVNPQAEETPVVPTSYFMTNCKVHNAFNTSNWEDLEMCEGSNCYSYSTVVDLWVRYRVPQKTSYSWFDHRGTKSSKLSGVDCPDPLE